MQTIAKSLTKRISSKIVDRILYEIIALPSLHAHATEARPIDGEKRAPPRYASTHMSEWNKKDKTRDLSNEPDEDPPYVIELPKAPTLIPEASFLRYQIRDVATDLPVSPVENYCLSFLDGNHNAAPNETYSFEKRADLLLKAAIQVNRTKNMTLFADHRAFEILNSVASYLHREETTGMVSGAQRMTVMSGISTTVEALRWQADHAIFEVSVLVPLMHKFLSYVPKGSAAARKITDSLCKQWDGFVHVMLNEAEKTKTPDGAKEFEQGVFHMGCIFLLRESIRAGTSGDEPTIIRNTYRELIEGLNEVAPFYAADLDTIMAVNMPETLPVASTVWQSMSDRNGGFLVRGEWANANAWLKNLDRMHLTPEKRVAFDRFIKRELSRWQDVKAPVNLAPLSIKLVYLAQQNSHPRLSTALPINLDLTPRMTFH